MFCTVYPYFYLSIFNRNHMLVIELRMTTFYERNLMMMMMMLFIAMLYTLYTQDKT